VSDSVRCGAVALALLLASDAVALVRGGRTEVPVDMLWVFVAGLLLPILNLYFVAKDALRGRGRAAALGAVLSGLAMLEAFSPAWIGFLKLQGGRT
jgi:hypothetical protein